MFKCNVRGMFVGACCAAIMMCGGANGMTIKNDDSMSLSFSLGNDDSISFSLSLPDQNEKYLQMDFFEDEEENPKLSHVWSDTGEKVSSLEEYYAVKPWKNVDLPIDEKTFNEYYKQYKAADEDSLIASQSFFYPMYKIGNQIEFSCVNGKDPSWIFPQIRRFVELILKYEDPDFRRFLISQFFDASISINPLKNYADDLALCSGLSKEDVFKKLFLDVVDRELNALIDLADPDGEIIRWRFNSTEY